MISGFFLSGIIVWLAGALACLALWRKPATARCVGCGTALAGSLLELVGSAAAIFNDSPATIGLPFGNPVFSWTISIDPLSAFFNVTLGVLAAAVSLYSFGYLREMEGRRNLGAFGFFFNLLLMSLALVFTASNVFFFLVAWEVMALSAFCLISFEHEKTEARKAGVLFLIMSHAGTGLLLIAFLNLTSASGSLDFSNFYQLASSLSPLQQGAVFLLFLFGFGVKAGLVPLHIWLPEAHSVSPSNVSALMSGIVIKTGIYGMARVFFSFYGPPPIWMGTVVLALGVVSALLGVLYALMEHDLKRLLAWHSIENIGIILMGFGTALMFRSLDQPNLAALALIAGLYHTFNHATFKGLLFLGAGSVVQSTHTRNMEKMGGLIRLMPVTAICFLVGAVAISGLPPLNGFVSEWLTYQALLAGFGTTQSLTRLMFPIAGSLLALTAALAATCFVKAFAIPFLALPRSEQAADAKEASATMRAGMAVLAVGCVALGLGATWIVRVFDPITQQTLGVSASSAMVMAHGMALSPGTPHGGTISTTGMALLFLLAGAAFALPLAWRWRRRSVKGPTWDCGLPGLTADNEYTATAFSKPLRMIFSALYRPHREIQAEYEVSPYYPSAIRFESEIEPAFEKHLYEPLRLRIMALANRMRAIQAGSINAYLAYIFITLILLLLFGVRP
ncbi:MAG: hydrogenase 4 subunit B [Terracidiphilus sp.]|jgi:hydrogenase-4 component B